MTYEEHEGWLHKQKEHKKEIKEMAELMAEQEIIMEKLIADRDDIVVIEKARMMVEKDWKIRPSSSIEYTSYVSRYVNFPRFIGGDELAKELDQGFVEMHGEIRKLQKELNVMAAGREKDKRDFMTLNKAIPINVWDALSDRQRERIRKLLHKTLKKLAKGEKT